MSGYSRGNPAMGDVFRSVLVLGAIVLAVWFVGRLVTLTPDKPTSDVDWQLAASGVEPRLGFVPIVPNELPKSWRATSAKVAEDRWQLGVLDDSGEFFGLSQNVGSIDSLIRERAKGSKYVGPVEVAGQIWYLYKRPGKDLTFAREFGDQAVVVTSTAKQAEIEDYLQTLVRYSG